VRFSLCFENYNTVYLILLLLLKVFQGSPSSGYLQRGDVVLSIQNKDAKQLFQHEVNELIRKAGGSLQLTIQRFFKVL
jgi:hypothetical protein